MKHLVTAALPYSNGRPHVGHIAGAYLPADIYVRYRRARGDEVLFICGSDDNGVAITVTAQKEGLSPAEVVSKYNAAQKRAFDGLGIRFDVYGGTHMPHFVDCHNQLSQEFFREIHQNGYLTKKETEQLYDTAAGKFLPDRYVVGTCHHCGYDKANGDQCEHCGKAIDPLLLQKPTSVLTGSVPEVRTTVHWYLRLADFEARLKEWLESKQSSADDGEALWRPTVVNFALGQIKQGLPERAMTRDLDWGVPVPLDDPDAKGKVLYVWFDAPIGYVSFTAQLLMDRGDTDREFETWWKNPESRIVHFIGEDNILFHALIWPAMLMAYNQGRPKAGQYELPFQVVANSFLNIKFPGSAEEEKISKSRGTAIWIEDFLGQYDPDPLRYYLTAIAPESARTAYEPDEFLARNDNELVATLGNFINRIMTFAGKNFDGKVPEAGHRDPVDADLLKAGGEHLRNAAASIERFRFRDGLGQVMGLARAGNLYLDQKKPWVQKKTDPAAAGTTINVCLQTIRVLAILMQPFLPFAADKTARMLGLDPTQALAWPPENSPPDELPPGSPLGQPEILFRKLLEPSSK